MREIAGLIMDDESVKRLRVRRTLITAAVAAVVIALVLPTVLASTKSMSSQVSEVSVLRSSAYGSVLVVGSGVLKGFPLYEFSGDVGTTFGCGTKQAKGYDGNSAVSATLTCTGPMRDMVDDDSTDDWPAFTSGGAPIAGKGVNDSLLGVVHRKGLGNQVTYGGHPLYLFDPSSGPFTPQGEGYVETVAPLAPWHGYWWLVSSKNGEPAPGVATLKVGTLPDGTKVLAAKEDANIYPMAVTVYSFSGDRPGVSECGDNCSLTWVPLLSSKAPHVVGDISASDVGLIRRADGTSQVTYEGKPLYLYSREKAFVTRAGLLKATGTDGNGEGLNGPNGGTFSFIEPST
jgi:predicted lipoprotein with Yx(FWY)xxD motif